MVVVAAVVLMCVLGWWGLVGGLGSGGRTAVAEPWTVVVHIAHADAAGATVLRAQRPCEAARVAEAGVDAARRRASAAAAAAAAGRWWRGGGGVWRADAARVCAACTAAAQGEQQE